MNELKTCFKRVEYDLSGLLHYIEIGDIELPDIQRPFVWKNTKVRNLFDSLYAVFRGRKVLDADYREKHIEIAFRPRDAMIGRWFFASTLAGRYTNSPESTTDGDLARLRTMANVIRSGYDRLT